MNLIKTLTVSTLLCTSLTAAAEPLTAIALQRMQEFHLQQAEAKMSKEQFNHAWGDLAYLVCYVPNHHVALKHMMKLAPQLGKMPELQKYFERAIAQFPQDEELKNLYAEFQLAVNPPTHDNT